MQASETNFIRRVMQREGDLRHLKEALLFRHLISLEVFQTDPTGKRSQHRVRIPWRDYIGCG